MKKLIVMILCVTSLAIMLTGCSNDKKKGAFTVDKVAVTYVKAPLNVPSMVEKSQGLFEKGFSEYNLPVKYSELTAGPDQTAALASGDIQFLYAVGGTSVLLSASNGADIKIISMYSRSPEAFMMFSKDDSISSPADLKGKTIVGPKGTNLHELLLAYLKQGGLTQRDVNFVSMDLPSALAALEGGSADVALQAGASAYNLKKKGMHMVTNGAGLIDATIVVATSNDFYQKNPALVKKFLDIQKSTLTYMNANYDQTMEIAAKETGLDTAAVKEMYPMYNFDMQITEHDIKSLEKTCAFMLENGMLGNKVDVRNLILQVN